MAVLMVAYSAECLADLMDVETADLRAVYLVGRKAVMSAVRKADSKADQWVAPMVVLTVEMLVEKMAVTMVDN